MYSDGVSDTGAGLYWYIAEAAELPLAYRTFARTSSQDVGGWLFQLRGHDPDHPLTLYLRGSSTTVGGPTTLYDNAFVIAFGVHDGSDTAPFTIGGTGWSLGDEAQSDPSAPSPGGVASWYASRGVASASTVPDLTVTPSASDGMQSLMIVINSEFTDDEITGRISHVGTVAANQPGGGTTVTPDFSGEDWEVDDLLIVTLYKNEDGGDFTVPAGWTAGPTVQSSSGDDRELAVFYRFAELGEDETPTFSHDAAADRQFTAVIDIYRNVDTDTPINDSDALAYSNNNQPVPPTVDVLAGGFVWASKGTHTVASMDNRVPHGFTETGDYTDDTNYTDAGIILGYKEINHEIDSYQSPIFWDNAITTAQECAVAVMALNPGPDLTPDTGGAGTVYYYGSKIPWDQIKWKKRKRKKVFHIEDNT
jgi:hypothetical protein